MKSPPPETPSPHHFRKTHSEIKYAHDLLLAIMRRDLYPNLCPSERDIIAASVSALCWVLGDDHHSEFVNLIKDLCEKHPRLKPNETTKTSNPGKPLPPENQGGNTVRP